jgi:alkylation response protein AidB-like acyl-CoA dehydrogenase
VNAVVNELRDSARQVLDGLGRAAAEQTAWPQIAELGWLMIATPEEQGGLGMGLAGACALHMELGRGLATVPFLPAILAIDAVSQGTLADQEAWLARLTSGEDYVAAPLAESTLGIERGANDELRLTGTAVAVPSADRASHVLVCITAGDCVALVPLAQPGVETVSRPTWDETRRLYDVRFTDVKLDAQLQLASGADARALTARLATLRDFALAADAIGGAQALLELTVAYLQTRQQFGRPLALFQSLKHRCADLKALTEGADALLYDKLGRVGERLDDLDAELAGKAVKGLACTAFATVAEEALQLHGGIGMTSEHDCHLFLKRAMLNEHLGRGQHRYEADLAARFLGNVI